MVNIGEHLQVDKSQHFSMRDIWDVSSTGKQVKQFKDSCSARKERGISDVVVVSLQKTQELQSKMHNPTMCSTHMSQGVVFKRTFLNRRSQCDTENSNREVLLSYKNLN